MHTCHATQFQDEGRVRPIRKTEVRVPVPGRRPTADLAAPVAGAALRGEGLRGADPGSAPSLARAPLGESSSPFPLASAQIKPDFTCGKLYIFCRFLN